MNITKAFLDNTLTITPDGRLDTSTAPALESEIVEGCKNADKLVLDLGKLVYISSAGLRVLLSAHKTMSKKGGMVLRNVSDSVFEILEITGFSDILTIEK